MHIYSMNNYDPISSEGILKRLVRNTKHRLLWNSAEVEQPASSVFRAYAEVYSGCKKYLHLC